MRHKAAVTIAELARAVGVAKSTVSLAFSTPERVRPETLSRILDEAERSGYQPNPLAQSLRTGRHNLLGLMMNDMANPHNGAFFSAVQAEALARGFLVLAATSHDDPAREAAILDQFRAIRVRGAILTPHFAWSEAPRAPRLWGPLVTFDQRAAGLSCDHVGLDNRGAAGALTHLLMDAGHRRIGHVAGRRGLWSAEERIEGVREALAERGLPLEPDLVESGGYEEGASQAAALRLLQGPGRPTALVAANNAAAVGTMRALRQAGLRCPEDVSVVTVDGLPAADLTDPPVTAAVQPVEAMARQAAAWLFEGVEAAPAEAGRAPRTRLFEAWVIHGRSVGPPAR
jgi:LacI family transcriptional regulator